MANTYNVQTMIDGPKNFIVKVDVTLDGNSGDFTIPQTIVNCAVMSPMEPNKNVRVTRVRVDEIDWDVQNGLAVNLAWDGAGPMPLWRMVGRSIEKSWREGGLQNNADQPNGNITMTTTTTAAPGAPLVATFKLKCVKQK